MRALGTDAPDPMLRYYTWNTLQPVPDGSVELVFSHVVLNHIDDIDGMYRQCARWLRLAPRYRHISDEDLATQTGFMVSRKRPF